MSYLEGPATTENKSENSTEESDSNKKKSRKVASKLLTKEVGLNSETSAKELKKDDANLSIINKLSEDQPVIEERAPEDKLSEEEKQLIIAVLREEAREQRTFEEIEDPTVEQIYEALDEFDDKLINERQDIDLATREILNDQNLIFDESILVNEQNEIASKEDESLPPNPTEESEIWLNEPKNETDQSNVIHVNHDQNEAVKSTSISGNEPNVAQTNNYYQEKRYKRDDNTKNNLSEGIMGYLISRRKQRVKTEKKIAQVQHKLESQIISLDKQLKEKERIIIKAVIENNSYRNSERPTVPVYFNKEPSIKEVIKDRKTAPEAQRLHVVPKAEKRIGHLLITNEAHSEVETSIRTTDKPEIQVEKLDDKKVMTMNRVELLKTSEKVLVEGSTLRQIYETHLIGEKGLRRLLSVYLKGGNLAKALRKEIVEREIDFERDPQLRDMPSTSSSDSSSNSTADATLNQMISKATASFSSVSEEVAFFKAKAEYEKQEILRQQKQRRTSDAVLVSTITILIVAILFLYLNRH